jgi:predicted O-methyltransferase YrrM
MGLRTFLGLKAARKSTDWVTELDLTAKWAKARFPVWDQVFHRREKKILQVLEIGSFEGLGTNYFLRNFPNCSVTCIDPFMVPAKDGKPLMPRAADAIGMAEARFDANTKDFAARVKKIKDKSVPILHRMAAENEAFDLIYIDGDHSRAAVLNDSILAWPLLKVGGIVIWDDYEWKQDWPRHLVPKDAIDLFVEMFGSSLRILHKDYQVIAEKIFEWPS